MLLPPQITKELNQKHFNEKLCEPSLKIKNWFPIQVWLQGVLIAFLLKRKATNNMKLWKVCFV